MGSPLLSSYCVLVLCARRGTQFLGWECSVSAQALSTSVWHCHLGFFRPLPSEEGPAGFSWVLDGRMRKKKKVGKDQDSRAGSGGQICTLHVNSGDSYLLCSLIYPQYGSWHIVGAQ